MNKFSENAKIITVSFLIIFLSLPAAFAQTAKSSSNNENKGSGESLSLCKRSANNMLQSSITQAQSDYWLAIAKSNNIPTVKEKNEAQKAAKQQMDEDIKLAQDQLKARITLCAELNDEAYHPVINPANFVDKIDNPYLPLVPGTVFLYQNETPGGVEHIRIEVTDKTRNILGVNCIIVKDTVKLENKLVEDTIDYFTQDSEGNVWYFGELVQNFEDGILANLDGSWTAGVDGAQPGIVMKANPKVGDIYRQEFFLGDAEDTAKIISRSGSASTPYGNFHNLLETKEFSPTTPGVNEFKFYQVGIGLVYVEEPANAEKMVLIDIQHH